VLGLDFGGSKIAVAVASADGRRLAEAVVATDPTLGARPNLARGIGAARDLLAEVAPGRTPAAVGAATFGIPEMHGIGLAPAIAGWEQLSLARELSKAFGCERVRVATDVKAGAAAEVRFGALAGHDPALYVNLGTGLAVALVVGGDVVLGANGAAGEIGYNLLTPDDVGHDERPMLEGRVSGTGLAVAARASICEDLTAAEVFERAPVDARLASLVEELVRHLCFHVVNLAVALNPSRIAVGGGLVGSWDQLEAPLRRALDAAVPFPPQLVVGAFPFDAALVGAVALALEAADGSWADISSAAIGSTSK